MPQFPVTWIVLATPVWSAGALAAWRVSKTRHCVTVKNAFGGGLTTLGAAGGRRCRLAGASAVLPLVCAAGAAAFSSWTAFAPACPAEANASWSPPEPAAATAVALEGGGSAKAATAAEAKRTQASRERRPTRMG